MVGLGLQDPYRSGEIQPNFTPLNPFQQVGEIKLMIKCSMFETNLWKYASEG